MASRNLLLGMTPPFWCRHVLRSLAIARKLKDNNTLVFGVVPAASYCFLIQEPLIAHPSVKQGYPCVI